MPKSIKAIDLVWKAQPAMACLKSILERAGNKQMAEDIREWLDNARELLNRKERRK